MDGPMSTADLRTMGHWLPEAPVHPAGPRILVETMPIPDGPHAPLLRAARDTLCAAALARGITLIISEDWEDLEAVNAANRASWVPILHRAPSLPSFWVGGVDREGDMVVTQAGLLVDCAGVNRTFADRLSALDVLYDDPAREAPIEERCFGGGGSLAWETEGAVCWIIAGWVRPDYRGGRGNADLFHLVGRLVRLVSWLHWAPRYWCGVVMPETVPSWSEERAGRRHLSARPDILYIDSSTPRPPLRFLRICRAGALLDLRGVAYHQTACA